MGLLPSQASQRSPGAPGSVPGQARPGLEHPGTGEGGPARGGTGWASKSLPPQPFQAPVTFTSKDRGPPQPQAALTGQAVTKTCVPGSGEGETSGREGNSCLQGSSSHTTLSQNSARAAGLAVRTSTGHRGVTPGCPHTAWDTPQGPTPTLEHFWKRQTQVSSDCHSSPSHTNSGSSSPCWHQTPGEIPV